MIDDYNITTFLFYYSKDGYNKIMSEFKGRTEFDLRPISLISKTSFEKSMILREILDNQKNEEESIFILCDENHRFTDYYYKQFFFFNIFESYNANMDMLLGSIDNADSVRSISNHQFQSFGEANSSFLVIFDTFFETSTNFKLSLHHNVLKQLQNSTVNKVLMFPMISTDMAKEELLKTLLSLPFKNSINYKLSHLKQIFMSSRVSNDDSQID